MITDRIGAERFAAAGVAWSERNQDCTSPRVTVASHAVMNGVPVPVVSRLLGHSNVRMTLRYAHLGDRDIEDAAERVGQAVAAIMRGQCAP